ncbi:MAG: galactokinase [Phaeodactylibacter xiamenensis]|uniref:Galactokinase n=1 Tax=Phaeodactylibacter xiamenensis TaxID=1524460 RepID=A0A098S1N9_9BACT|nr:galactokinase [Phaeodactylibacter xiamenensis]KGE86045.1 galactokinase [Phaeodactylibacter xiamenensis]MCR9050384.1 galactokinase [bacterium]
MNTLENIASVFRDTFSSQPLLVQGCGRINIIGEHTDYNEGFVLPASINRYIYFAIAENGTNECHFHALDINDSYQFSLSDIKKSDKSWANYLMGILDQLQKENILLEGVDVVFGGNLPIGSGMSSSAALEAGFALGICSLFNLQKSRQELAQLAHRSSNNFIGIPSGIMDQFASLLGQRGQAIKLDCRSLQYEYVQLDLKDYELLLINTGVSHALANSAYKDRVRECREGAEAVAQKFEGIQSLRDVSLEQLEACREDMTAVVYQRCRYVIEENERLHQALHLLTNGEMEALGELLLGTHEGLSKEYEVSCRELDFLVELAKDHEGVAGARMMGGGFGGCTLNLVKKSAKEDFLKYAKKEYYRAFSVQAEHYELEIVDGTDIVRG